MCIKNRTCCFDFDLEKSSLDLAMDCMMDIVKKQNDKKFSVYLCCHQEKNNQKFILFDF